MNESGKAVLWNRNFIQCCVSYFLMNFAYYMLMPTLPIYLVEELRMGTSEVGWVLSIYTIGVLCVRPFSGYLVDCFSRKALYLFAFTIFAGLFVGYWFALTIGALASLLSWPHYMDLFRRVFGMVRIVCSFDGS